MNERQIRQMRKKFILISTLSFFGVMLLMGGLIYGFSEVALRNEVRQIMAYIAEQEAEEGTVASLPMTDETEDVASQEAGEPAETDEERLEWDLRRLFGTGGLFDTSADYLRTIGYFAVQFSAEGQVEKITSSHVLAMEESQIIRYAERARHRLLGFGNIGRFYYNVISQEDGGTLVIYVDRRGQVEVNNRILFATLIILGFGTFLAFLVMRVMSMRVVRPEIENAERQKQFITNASHELKTPLAVIRANTEMQEMIEGETEWTASTMRQVERMSGLIENLVKIARSSEEDSMEMRRVDIARVAEETAGSFLAVAVSDGKGLETEIERPLEFITDESALRQLLTLLVDNAVKYCDPEGVIRCGTKRSGKNLELWVSNPYAEGVNVDYRRFFDRFYRADASHNTNAQKGGYGIGLSIAESLVKSLKGKLEVSWKEGIITFRAILPEGRMPDK